MVSFETFWSRLKTELETLPVEQGCHIGRARKWSQHSGDLGEDFVFFSKGGNLIYCGTTTTNNEHPMGSRLATQHCDGATMRGRD